LRTIANIFYGFSLILSRFTFHHDTAFCSVQRVVSISH